MRTEIVEAATEAPALVQAVNQGLSGATILCGISLILLVFSLHRGEEASHLYASLEAVNEELIHLRRSQEQHYKQTFSSITDNLDHGVVLYRRNEILPANQPLTLLIRPGAKSWEDVEPELDVLLERTHKARLGQKKRITGLRGRLRSWPGGLTEVRLKFLSNWIEQQSTGVETLKWRLYIRPRGFPLGNPAKRGQPG